MAAMHAREKNGDNSIQGLTRQNSQKKLKYSRNIRKGHFFDIAPYTITSTVHSMQIKFLLLKFKNSADVNLLSMMAFISYLPFLKS